MGKVFRFPIVMTRGFGRPSGTTEALLAQAVGLYHQGRLAEACALYKEILHREPARADVHLALGLALQKRGDGAAIDHFEQAAALAPTDANAQFVFGSALQRAGKAEMAQLAYLHTLSLDPEYAKAHFGIASLHYERGELLEAAEAYRRAIDIEPRYLRAHQLLGRVLLELGDPAAAIASLRQAVQLQPDSAESYHSLGMALEARQQFSEAAGVYRTALLLRPDMGETLVRLGGVLHLLGQSDEALALLRRAVALAPEAAQAHCSLANVLRDLGEFPAAAASYSEALRLAPDYAEARHFLAVVGGAPVPERAEPEYVAALFNHYAESFEAHLTGQLGYLGHVQVCDALLGQLASSAPAILDLGCGTGLCGVRLRKIARRLVGVDLSPRMIDKARQTGVYDALAVADLADWLAQHREAFDAVVAADVFTYLGDLTEVFGQVAATLLPGGCFAFSAEVAETSETYVLQQSGHYAHSRAYLEQTATRSGLAVLSVAQATLRTENSQAILAWIVVAAKLPAGTTHP